MSLALITASLSYFTSSMRAVVRDDGHGLRQVRADIIFTMYLTQYTIYDDLRWLVGRVIE